MSHNNEPSSRTFMVGLRKINWPEGVSQDKTEKTMRWKWEYFLDTQTSALQQYLPVGQVFSHLPHACIEFRFTYLCTSTLHIDRWNGLNSGKGKMQHFVPFTSYFLRLFSLIHKMELDLKQIALLILDYDTYLAHIKAN